MKPSIKMLLAAAAAATALSGVPAEAGNGKNPFGYNIGIGGNGKIKGNVTIRPGGRGNGKIKIDLGTIFGSQEPCNRRIKIDNLRGQVKRDTSSCSSRHGLPAGTPPAVYNR